MIRAFEISLSFLTIWRVRTQPPAELTEVARASWAFPVVGMLIGGILALAHWALDGHVPTLLSAVVVLGLWILLTGGLHLDGWADCGDALLAAVPPERRFEILKDSRLGTFGALALILLLAVKGAAIAGANLSVFQLFLAPVVGRGVMVLAASGARHPDRGMAALFVSGLDPNTVRKAAIVGLGPALLAGWAGIAAAACACLVALWYRSFAERRLGTINGDVLGATCELSEAVFLLVASARW
ncbi:MAG: adenosylcobinamide-GDP ribazoletransferase [Desulfomonile tiedjei]|nr:adenosylcobinamide-GDP ribazoletransferase [Desulfomonile tiedjei]